MGLTTATKHRNCRTAVACRQLEQPTSSLLALYALFACRPLDLSTAPLAVTFKEAAELDHLYASSDPDARYLHRQWASWLRKDVPAGQAVDVRRVEGELHKALRWLAAHWDRRPRTAGVPVTQAPRLLDQLDGISRAALDETFQRERVEFHNGAVLDKLEQFAATLVPSAAALASGIKQPVSAHTVCIGGPCLRSP